VKAFQKLLLKSNSKKKLTYMTFYWIQARPPQDTACPYVAKKWSPPHNRLLAKLGHAHRMYKQTFTPSQFYVTSQTAMVAMLQIHHSRNAGMLGISMDTPPTCSFGYMPASDGCP